MGLRLPCIQIEIAWGGDCVDIVWVGDGLGGGKIEMRDCLGVRLLTGKEIEMQIAAAGECIDIACGGDCAEIERDG